MGGVVLSVFGVVIILVVSYDFLRTTVSLSGTGFISRTIGDVLWRLGSSAAAALERRRGVSIRGLLGPSILFAIAGTWVLLHLVGYVLIFRSGRSLWHPDTGAPATMVETIAFAGSTLSTLGASTVTVTSGGWDMLSMIVALNGMIVLTLSVSFLLSIVQTTNSARTFASRFRFLKSATPDGAAAERIEGLGPDLLGVVVMLTASPLPRFFVPGDPVMDFPTAIAELCDMARRGTLSPSSEIVSALRLLGRHLGKSSDGDDLAAARAWAERHTIVRASS
ncbi:hypothetical protein [Paracoccus rhizosphaerae]|uniref:Ion channel n=1 Tax=Paracoccus rhizosphaerae TaxID=1133347 RepID=A0ABV6CE54_9RHOB|nr:hypothetical protein [Paracoccus rhizosphaerae]